MLRDYQSEVIEKLAIAGDNLIIKIMNFLKKINTADFMTGVVASLTAVVNLGCYQGQV